MSKRLLFTGALCALSAQANVSDAMAARAKVTQAPQAAAPIEFLFEPRGVYALLTSPGRITDIALEPGERLVDTNPIAAGDTARWIIGDTSSGKGETRRVHVLVKPTAVSLRTNLVINTDRRTYFLDLRGSGSAFVTQVSWRYPAPVKPAPVVIAPAAPAQPPKLNFNYALSGSRALRPLQVYDDGARVWIVFGDRLRLEDLPPLYRVGPDGKTTELINYHVEGRALLTDRLFDQVELHFGAKRWSSRVRITRTNAASESGR
ncbi:P-type conjugative transfer protein TrbG [Caulobacter sp.]|uniref:P-type conjugative transfer protein TrbG n=1 Tax=Caulobacter sp. TaxID=78 RepID=UPI0031E050DA